ncbi:hypothetical protein ACVJGD_004188 [Bradyrhizobium sp. USDA 10063]
MHLDGTGCREPCSCGSCDPPWLAVLFALGFQPDCDRHSPEFEARRQSPDPVPGSAVARRQLHRATGHDPSRGLEEGTKEAPISSYRSLCTAIESLRSGHGNRRLPCRGDPRVLASTPPKPSDAHVRGVRLPNDLKISVIGLIQLDLIMMAVRSYVCARLSLRCFLSLPDPASAVAHLRQRVFSRRLSEGWSAPR